MIKDLLGSTESSSVGDSSTFGFSAEVLKTENFILSLTTRVVKLERVVFEVRWNAVSVTLWLL